MTFKKIRYQKIYRQGESLAVEHSEKGRGLEQATYEIGGIMKKTV